MRGSPFQKSLLILLCAAIVTALLLQWLNAHFQKTLPAATPAIIKTEHEYHYTPPANPAATPSVATNADETDEQIPVPKISREQAEAWLARHNRNAMSLLAAFRALGDTNLLNEAATNFPNDPHVELAVLAHDEFPADRRKWLDLFENSSPSNSLANYLSAQEDFKNGKNDEAVQELLAASGKSEFNTFDTETQLNSEELYSESGKSPIDVVTSGMNDWAGENMPQLGTYKRLAQGMAGLEKEFAASNDPDSAANLAQMGMTFAGQIQSGDSGKYLINELVGTAIQSVVLNALDKNTNYEFLNGKTPAQVLLEAKQQHQANKEIIQNWNAVYMHLTPEEMVNYAQRAKIFGEIPTMQWLIQQHPPVNPPK